MAPGLYNYAERWLQAVDSEVTLSIKTHTHKIKTDASSKGWFILLPVLPTRRGSFNVNHCFTVHKDKDISGIGHKESHFLPIS